MQSQTVPPQEIVVVDDGSDPEALAVLDDLETEGVRVLRNGTSRGGSAARNRGWKSGTAPWVAFLDDDDTFEPTKLELQMETVRRSGARWSWTDYRMVDRTHLDELDRIRPRNVTFVDVLARSPIPSSTLLIARDLLEAVGGFDEALPRNQDRDLILRLLLEAPGVPVEGEAPLTTMRWHMPDPASCLAGEEALHRKWADRTRALSPGERRRVESERHWNRWVNLARLPDRGAELRAVVAALGLRPWVGRYWRSLLIALLHAVGWRGRFAADEAKAGR